MRRNNSSLNPSVNLQDYGNINLKDLGSEDASSNPSARTAVKRGSIFSGFNMGAMLEDELVDSKKKAQGLPTPTSMLRNPSGHMITEQGVAQQVINDDVQWKKLQAEMKEKGAVSGMSLKQNLNGLLQGRAKELPSQVRRASASAVPNKRRTSYIADFATSLILGEGEHEPARRLSMQTPVQLSAPNPGRRFSSFFADSPSTNITAREDQDKSIRQNYNGASSLAPVIDLSNLTTQFEQPQKWNERGSVARTLSISSHVIHEDFDSDDDSDEDDKISWFFLEGLKG